MSSDVLQEQICLTWKMFFRAGDVIEMRIPNANQYRQTIAGYFDNPDDLYKAAKQCAKYQKSVYYTLNPANPALLARCANRADVLKTTTADQDITCRRSILVDMDAVRPSGISANEQEYQAGLARAAACREWLWSNYGIPSAYAASGNGGHLHIPVDLPNDLESLELVTQFLEALSSRFDDDAVRVDTVVTNAARICKFYGTYARKGDNLPERPHRLAQWLEIPPGIMPVPKEKLREVCRILPDLEDPPTTKQGGPKSRQSAGFELESWLAEHGIVARCVPYKDDHKWQLQHCPFNADHKDGDAAVFRAASGRLGFRCLHHSCQGKRWRDFRALFEPAAYDRQKDWSAQDRENTSECPPSHPGTSVSAKAESLQPARESPPEPLDEAAFHGLAGEFVRLFEPVTEGHPAAMLVQFLVAFGNLIGRNCYYRVGTARHHANLFAVVVGKSAKARKGTSWEPVRHLLSTIDPDYYEGRVKSGLSSGEGVIYNVRNPTEKQETDKKTGEIKTVVVDAGEQDKRLLVIETEFARALSVMAREGNTLSAQLRDAWDTGKLSTLTKNAPMTATGAHISVIGHITRDELLRKMTETEANNGLANRFLWVYAYRPHLLAFPPEADRSALIHLASRICEAAEAAKDPVCLEFDSEARGDWELVYPDLERDVAGLVGAVTMRGAPIVCRLALLYALLDMSNAIRGEHLAAALAVWTYCENSARYIFGDASGDLVADEILRQLRQEPEGLTRTEISNLFGRHVSAARLLLALNTLRERGVADMERRPTEGRPIEVWKATGQA